ncbi:MAG: Ycf48-like protein [Ignavibacteriaceae bacterium]|nr:Ycf48-like protein [Ignavibacteriaceae bacterium]
MFYKKSQKVNFLLSFLLALLLLPSLNYTQHLEQQKVNYIRTDSTAEKPVQYRRGIELQEGYQTYEQKYSGKNLNEEKRRLFPLQSTGIWTELNPGVPRVTYFGVHFVNPDTGCVVGDLGSVIKTMNGGDDWTISETNTTTLILKVHSFNGQVVVAPGFDGLILRSSDAGETFTQIQGGTTSDLWGVQMLNDTLGFVCGLNQTLLRTTDSGLNWQSIAAGLNAHYWALDFLNEQYGIIACGGGKVLRTTDGGNNWVQIQAGDASDLYAIDIIDSLHITAAGYLGKNVYSSDGGLSWVQNAALQHNELNSIRFIDENTGYTIGTYQGESWGIRKTTNRGQNWFNPPIGNLSEWELELLPDGVGYSVGSNLMINKTTSGYDNWGGLFLNAAFVDVYFTDELTGYSADGRWTGGPLYKTTDGGLSWFGLPNFPSYAFTGSLRCVIFTDSLTGFGGGMPARIVKTTDAGNSWYVVNRTGLTDTIGLINRIYFINPTTGWAVTTRGGILKTTNAGENWFAQLNAGVNVIFRSIHFVDSLCGWTANSSRRPHKTTDGGMNWIQQANLNFYNTDDVYFTNNDTGWVIDLFEDLNKTTNGGLSWSLVTGINSPRNFGFFPNKYHWLVHGFGGYVYETHDGGNTFTDISNDVPSAFIKFSAPLNYLGYAVGSLGLVLRYFDSTYVPVELVSFDGRIENDKIILSWQTASELNNRGFQVEKSFDKERWFNIGFVEGNGTSSESNYYFFIDNEIASGVQFYRLKQIDYNGSFEYSKIIKINSDLTFISFRLFQNYPNPFNSSTTVVFDLPEKSLVLIKLYSITGEEVVTLVNGELDSGRYHFLIDGNNLASGVYLLRMISNDFISSKKIIMMK